MQEQKYKYFIDGKEVDNRTDYLNATMSGDYVSYFDGDSVFSVSFNSFFGGQKEKQIEQRLKLTEYYKEKAIKEYELDTPLTKASRGLNDHVKDTLDLGQIKGSSTRHKSQNGETHKELTTENTIEDISQLMLLKNKKQLYKRLAKISAEKENKTEDTEQIVTTTITLKTNKEQTEKIKEIVKEFNKQNSAEKTEKEEKIRKNVKLSSLSNYFILKNIDGHIVKHFQDISAFLTDEQLEEIKILNFENDLTLLVNGKLGYPAKEITKITEKENKTEENLIFPKDSEIHKEDLPPHQPLDFSLLLADWTDRMSGTKDRPATFTVGKGVKETEGKLNYELDWEFIQQMAERMSQNKGKYEPYNWKRPMEVEKLKQSLLRHVIEVMKGNYSDDNREFGHLESIALNSMMINYQLKNNSK